MATTRKLALFHIFFVPIVWAIVLYMAVRDHYGFSEAERIWIRDSLFCALLFRIVVAVELCWGLENCLLRIPSYHGRNFALFAIRLLFRVFGWWVLLGTMMFVLERIGISKNLLDDRQYWCFLTFLLMGFYEMAAFFYLALLRENCLLRIPSYHGRSLALFARSLALFAIRLVFHVFVWWVFIRTMLFVLQWIGISTDRNWCFFTFLLMGFGEMDALFNLALLRVMDIKNKGAEPEHLSWFGRLLRSFWSI